MRICGGCTACCTWLVGDAYGHVFGNGKSCRFLCEHGCTIHKIRPTTCINYQCAWSQGLLDLEMRPDKCGVLVSVENGDSGQYLKLVPTRGVINIDTLDYFKSWSIKMNTPVLYFKNYNWEEL